MSNQDTHSTTMPLKERVFMVVLFILSLVVSAVVIFYFSPTLTTRSITPATNVTHLSIRER